MNFYQNFLHKTLLPRTIGTSQKVIPYVSISEKILDIGSGGCEIARYLKNKGYTITALDIKNKSIYPDCQPQIYDGKKLPFDNNSFDCALLLTVLHHTPNPESILSEASRVAKKIVIIEDTYTSKFDEIMTKILDSIFNFEFLGHPHSNKTDEQWKELFKKMKLTIAAESSHRFYTVMTSSTYILDRK